MADSTDSELGSEARRQRRFDPLPVAAAVPA